MVGTKAWTTKATVVGIADNSDGTISMILQTGKLSATDVSAREYFYDMDLNGDTVVSVVGQTTAPTGWAL
jgi:hypothetical protein